MQNEKNAIIQIVVDNILAAIDEAKNNFCTHINNSSKQGLFAQIQIAEAEMALAELDKITRFVENKHGELIISETKNALEKRWKRIKGTFLGYTSLPKDYMSLCYLKLAQALHAFAPERKVFQYLMPTITCVNEALYLYERDIDSYDLGCLILSDQMNALIPVNVLSALVPGEVHFKNIPIPYVKSALEEVRPLTNYEQERLIKHSDYSRELHNLYQKIESLQQGDTSVGGRLRTLIAALRKGSVEQEGVEYDASVSAYLGVCAFMDYWNNIDPNERGKIGQLKSSRNPKTLQEILDILSTRTQLLTCVKINATILEAILEAYPSLNDYTPHYISLIHEHNYYKKALDLGTIGYDDLSSSTLNARLIGKHFLSLYHIDEGLQACYEALLQQGQDANLATLIIVSYLNLPNSSAELIYKKGKNGEPFLLWAIKNNQFDLVNTVLMSRHCSRKLLCQQDNAGDTLLSWALKNKQLNIVNEILVSPYCSRRLLCQQDNEGNTILLWALKNKYLMLAMKLLADPYCSKRLLFLSDKQGSTALMWAIENKQPEIIDAIFKSAHYSKELLLQYDKEGNTPWLWTIKNMQLSLIYTILRGPHCSKELFLQKTAEGDTILSWAIKNQPLGMIDLILTSPYCSNELLLQQDIEGNTPLLWAIKNKQLDSVKQILTSIYCSKELLRQQDKEGYSVLVWAIENKLFSVVAMILASPYCSEELLCSTDSKEDSPLLWAIRNKQFDLGKKALSSPHCSEELLLKQDSNGNDVLILAIKMKKFDLVRAILMNQHCSEALLKQQDNEGNSALLSLALTSDSVDTVAFFLASRFCSYEVLSAYNSLSNEKRLYMNPAVEQLIRERITLLAPKEYPVHKPRWYAFFNKQVTNITNNLSELLNTPR